MTFWSLLTTSNCKTFFHQHWCGLFRAAFSIPVMTPFGFISPPTTPLEGGACERQFTVLDPRRRLANVRFPCYQCLALVSGNSSINGKYIIRCSRMFFTDRRQVWISKYGSIIKLHKTAPSCNVSNFHDIVNLFAACVPVDFLRENRHVVKQQG